MEKLTEKINGLIKRRPRRCDDCDVISGIVYVVQFGQTHSVSEMGDALIWAQNSMPQNLMKIKQEVPEMLQVNIGYEFWM